jgi:hypothetical protein
MESKPQGYEKKEVGVDPETGSVSWKVTYKANYNSLFKKFNELNKEFKEFLLFDEIKKDPKFKEIYSGFNYLFNQFRSHLRSEYPKEYKSIQLALTEQQLREFIQAKLQEISATGAGASAATYTPGQSENTDLKYAFNPNKKAKGAQNIYYYKLSGYKPVDAEKLHKTSKAIDHKDLWKKKLTEDESTQSYINSLNLEDSSVKQFIEKRISDFDKIEDKLNTLLPLLKQAKTETMEFYKNDPSFTIRYGTDLAIDYLDDLITLFKEKK